MDSNDAKEIGRGAFNITRKILGVPNTEMEAKAAERMNICMACPIISDSKTHCDKKKGGCGCPLGLRTRSNKGCPKGKW